MQSRRAVDVFSKPGKVSPYKRGLLMKTKKMKAWGGEEIERRGKDGVTGSGVCYDGLRYRKTW